MKYDEIHIENLEFYARHGVFPEETKLGQKFIISLVMYTDTRAAGKKDELELSIDYGEVSHFITEYMEKNTFKLIEAAAENLAGELLLRYPLLEGVELELKKPWAPVGLPMEYVSVKISRFWHKVYLGLGSNMGDKKGYLDQAVKRLDEEKECKVEKVSGYLVTEPYGGVEQDDFTSFVGRLGVRGGFYFPEKKGNVYARVSVLHDFDGEMETNASLGRAHNTIKDDMGGTWVEYGVGANFSWTDTTYTYVDLERNSGGEVVEHWRWNVGLRHVF